MDRPGVHVGCVSLCLASLNLAVPPLAGYLADRVAQAASSSEAALWGGVCCLGFGALASIGLGVAWLLFIVLAIGRRWRDVALVGVGLLLNGIAINWAISAFRLG